MRRNWAGSLLLACGNGALALAFGGCASPAPQPVSTQGGRCFSGQHFDGESCVQDSSAPPPAASPSATKPQEQAQTAPPAPAPEGASATSSSDATPAASAQGAEPSAPSSEAQVPSSPPPRATPVDISMASAAGPLIAYIASTHVPSGARPFGTPFAGQFTQGQILAQRVQLAPGHCYTALAAGMAPVKGVRLGFFPVDLKDPAYWAEPAWMLSEPSGSQAVLGRKETCFRPAAGQVDAWLLLEVTEGQGVAAAQIFEK